MNCFPSRSQLRTSLCWQCRHRLLPRPSYRTLSTEDGDPIKKSLSNLLQASKSRTSNPPPEPNTSSFVNSILAKNAKVTKPSATLTYSPLQNILNYRPVQPFQLSIYSTRHNCHITFSNPKGRAWLSLSAGNIGFRKGHRGSYDAAYQLAAYTMARLNQHPKKEEIDQVQLVFRDFGPGREAALKILLSPEGSAIRSKIIRVMDATRLKFGGTRSKKPRRLG